MGYRLARAATVLASALALLSVSAVAEAGIDQSFVDPSSAVFGGGCEGCASFGFAQTFTDGVTGTLTGVHINALLSGAPGPYVLSVNAVVGGVPTTTMLSATTLPAGSFFDIFTEIDLPDISVVAGQQHALVLSYPSGANLLSWTGAVGDFYAGGSAWVMQDGGFSQTAPPTGADLNFQTRVDRVPLPGSLLLLIVGLSGLRRMGRGRRRVGNLASSASA